MERVHRELALFLRSHGVRRDARMLVAVSGGGDSVALLHALLALGQRVAAGHVHHGLRGAAADADLAFVATLSHALGVPFVHARVDAATRDGRSPEARARTLRYAALEELRADGGFAHIATAHQREDQAETLLFRALRGTGIGGLASIRPSLDGGRVLRPLLALSRAELRDYLAARGLAHREDASNADLSIPRNRLRAEVLPVLESIQPGATAHLAALALRAAEADDSLREPLDSDFAAFAHGGDGGLWLDPVALAGLDSGRRRRAIVEIASRAGLRETLSVKHVERIDAFLARAEPGRKLSLPGGCVLLRDRVKFWLGPATGPHFPTPVCVELPRDGALEFPERGFRLSWHACEVPAPPSALLRLPARPDERLIARSPLSDDRVFARGRERPLKEVFASARWGRDTQARALIIERGGEIVWIPGLLRRATKEIDAHRFELRAERLPSPSQNC
jgi:tRNA(Ile)-lysidine synthase